MRRLPSVLLLHHDPLPIHSQHQDPSTSRRHRSAAMVGLKILAQITCQPFRLPFGDHTARRVDEVPNGFIKGVLYCRSRYLGSQTIGVLVGRKIQLGIQREDVIGISTTIALPPNRELPKQRLQATLTVAPTIGTL